MRLACLLIILKEYSFFTSHNCSLYLETANIMVDIPTFPWRKNICPLSESYRRKTVIFLFIHCRFCSLCNWRMVVLLICKSLPCKVVANWLYDDINVNRKSHCGTILWSDRERDLIIHQSLHLYIEFSALATSLALRHKEHFF